MQTFHQAVQKANVEVVLKNMKDEKIINATDAHGKTALHFNAENGNRFLGRVLIEHKASLEHKDSQGFTPFLTAATSKKAYAGVLDYIEITMCYGADISTVNNQKKGINELASPEIQVGVENVYLRFQQLANAVRLQRLAHAQVLLRQPTNVNFQNPDGNSLAHVAVLNNDEPMLTLLLTEGARLDIKNSAGLTVRQVAEKHPNLVKIIDDFESARKVLITAVVKNDVGALPKLMQQYKAYLNIKDEHRNNLLEVATRSHATDAFKLLYAANPDQAGHPFWQETLMHYAAMCGANGILEFLVTQPKANINATDKFGLTPLHRAAQFGGSDCIQVLLSNGADIEMRDRWNCTPLHWAAHCGNTGATLKLLGSNAKLDVKNIWGNTAAMLAKENGYMAIATSLMPPAADTASLINLASGPLSSGKLVAADTKTGGQANEASKAAETATGDAASQAAAKPAVRLGASVDG